MSKNKPIPSITYVVCESKLRSVVRPSVHPCLGDCACGRVFCPGVRRSSLQVRVDVGRRLILIQMTVCYLFVLRY